LCNVEALTFSLDRQLTDGGEVVSLTHRPPFIIRKFPGTHFQAHSAAGRIRSNEKSNNLTGNRTRDLPTSSFVLQSATLPEHNYPQDHHTGAFV
jgi:hypothetical protein